MKLKEKNIYKRLKLLLICTVSYFAVHNTVTVVLLVVAHQFYSKHLNEIRFMPDNIYPLAAAVLSLVVGGLLSVFLLKKFFLPLGKIILAMKKLSSGDYSVRIKPEGIAAVRHLGENFNHMAEKISSVEKMRNDFTDNFSHEIKTPVVSISGFAKMLRDDEASAEEKKEYLDIIISEAERLAGLSENVLRLTRLENAEEITDNTEFNLTEQIRTAIVVVDGKWSEKNMNFTLSEEEIIVSGNEELLFQVWLNILDNAVKFSPDGTTISVEISEIEDVINILIKDEGCGINEETAKYAFERLYRGKENIKTTGNGIGLAIVKKICKLHGGSVEIRNTGADGTVVDVKLNKK